MIGVIILATLIVILITFLVCCLMYLWVSFCYSKIYKTSFEEGEKKTQKDIQEILEILKEIFS